MSEEIKDLQQEYHELSMKMINTAFMLENIKQELERIYKAIKLLEKKECIKHMEDTVRKKEDE